MSDYGYLESDDEHDRPCGGCGETSADKRCIGCFHFFGQGDEWVFRYGTTRPAGSVS